MVNRYHRYGHVSDAGIFVLHLDYLELDKENKALKEELLALKEQMRWRDVREGLPDETGEYLVFASDGYRASWFNDGKFAIKRLLNIGVTHWMPLPAHPTTTSENKD